MALAARNDGANHRIYVLMGDGEIQEGSVWEAALQAPRCGLSNLTAIVDANALQGYGRVADIMPFESFVPRWESFGWRAVEIDGHDHDALREVLASVPLTPGLPTAVIARTVKGKGVEEMEDQLGWHYFSVPSEKVKMFHCELDGGQ